MASCLFPPPSVLLSENADDPPKKPIRMKGTMLFRVLPFCPVVSLFVSSL